MTITLAAADAAAPDWTRANCGHRTAHLFFGPEGERSQEREEREATARAVCGNCPIRHGCLTYAYTRAEKWGIWGGLTEEDRLRYKLTAGGTITNITCAHGHPYTPENTRWNGHQLRCRACSRTADKQYREKTKEAA